MHFPTSLTASQLKAKLPELEWQAAGTMSAVQYADMAAVTLRTAEIHGDVWARPWLLHGFNPAALAAVISAPLEGMDKTASPLGKYLDEVEAAARRLPTDKMRKLVVGTADTFALPAAVTGEHAPPPWQLKVTMGVIHACSIGARALAWLEYFAWERGEAPDANTRACKLLSKLDDLATQLGLSTADTGVEQRAVNAITALADYAYLENVAARYTPPGPARQAQLEEELRAASSASSGLSGDSLFAQALVPTVVANSAPLLTACLKGMVGRRGRNQLTLELAGAYTDGQIQAALRWASDDALRLYRRTEADKYGGWLLGAERVNLTAAMTHHLPRAATHVGGDGEVAAMIGDLVLRAEAVRLTATAVRSLPRPMPTTDSDGLAAAMLTERMEVPDKATAWDKADGAARPTAV